MDNFEDIYAVASIDEKQRARCLKRIMLDAEFKGGQIDLLYIGYTAAALFMIVLALSKPELQHYFYMAAALTLIAGFGHSAYSLFRKEKNRVNAINCYFDYLKQLGRKYAKSY